MKIKKIILIILIIIVATISFIFILEKNNHKNETIKKEKITNKEDNKDKTYSLDMIMVGDNLIHDHIYENAKKDNIYDFKPMYNMIKDIVSNYDIAYYNQETILGGTNIGLSSYPAFNSPYEVGDAMIDTGFNLVSLATNHTLDRGKTAVLNSREYWNSKEDVLAVGSYSSFDEKNKEQIKTKNNISYTLLNYTYGTNGIELEQGDEYLVNIWPVTGTNPESDIPYQQYKDEIKKDIDKVKNKVDVLIVAMHWGIEYETSPNNYQKDMANYLSSLGVNIIIGTHPHVVQPIEWINNTLVLYSLGNFFSAHEVINMDNRVGLISSIKITKKLTSDKKDIIIDNLNNSFVYTYYEENYKNIKVIPFTKINDSYLNNYKEIYNKYTNIVKSIDKNIKVEEIQ